MTDDSGKARELVSRHVARLTAGHLDGMGEDANRILTAVGNAPDLGLIAPLFASADVEVAKSLAFILSQLGPRAVEALPWLDSLIDHPDDYVRHHAVVSIQHSGTLEHGPVVAKAIATLDDSRPVAMAAVRYLSFGSLRQIATACPHVPAHLAEPIDWLVAEDWDDWAERSRSPAGGGLVIVAAAARLSRLGMQEPLVRLGADSDGRIADAAAYVSRFVPLPESS